MTVVSVITPTWQRQDLLMQRCIPSVREQTFPKVQHIIVSDGPDEYLARVLAGGYYCQLEDHPDGEVDYGSRARNVGLRFASGDYIAYLDDDNAYRPDHIATLAAALDDNPTVDFVFSMMLTTNGVVIGTPPPAYGRIDTSLLMHRAGVPQRLGWWPEPHEIAGDKHAPDWGVVERWLDGGATWMHVPQITVDYWS
jgi:glycosyltransferase involved in cell wall biosynthesis